MLAPVVSLLTRQRRRRRAPIAIVIAIGLVATSVVAATPRTAQAATNTVVSLTFDDGNADQLNALPVLKSHGMTGTFYTVSGWVGASGYQSVNDLKNIAAAGNEIGGHTVLHPDLPVLDPAEAQREICNDRKNLLGWGFQVSSLAYPYGDTSAAVESAAAACGYNSARQLGDIWDPLGDCPSGCDFAETIPPDDAYYTRAPMMVDMTASPPWTLATLQQQVQAAEQHSGGWVQLIFHHVCASGCELNITPTVLGQFLDWLKPRSAQGTVVKNVNKVVTGPVKAAVNGPVANHGLVNPSLETAGTDPNFPGYPQCWQSGGWGSNTATVTRTTDSHSGGFAERVDLTNYVSGDAKLLPTLDLGYCTPSATAGHTYKLGTWYKSSAVTQYALYYRDTIGHWIYWTSSPWFAGSSTYTQANWTTPPVPAGATGISFGLSLFSNGSLTTDDYSMADAATPGAPSPALSAGATSSTLLPAPDVSSKATKPHKRRQPQPIVTKGKSVPELRGAPASPQSAQSASGVRSGDIVIVPVPNDKG